MVTARILNNSRYFNTDAAESVPPTLSRTATSDVVNGKLTFNFSASDASGLAGATLTWKGDFVADQKLSGTTVNGSFATPYFTAGTSNDYAISVYDIFGNRQTAATSLSPKAGVAGAPIPSIKVSTQVGLPGDLVTIDATASTDPVFSNSSLTVRWDLNGDGVFDTEPTSTKTRSISLAGVRTRFVSAQIINPNTMQAISTPLYLHTEKPTLWVSAVLNQNTFQSRWISRLGFRYQVEKSSDLKIWTTSDFPFYYGTSSEMAYETPLTGPSPTWIRLRVSKRLN